MPRPTSPPRLWLRKARRRSNGRIRPATWIILHDGKHYATGCAEGETQRAGEKLAAYIKEHYRPAHECRDIEVIDIADVLSIYVDDAKERGVWTKKMERRMFRLNEYWGGKMLSTVTGKSCRTYAKARQRGGARRDLEDLKAAINYHGEEGFHRGIVGVVLPERGPPRDRWLTRDEAAELLWTCWRTREVQRRWRGVDTGKAIETKKHPLRHLARFILIGLYTGTRAGAIASASPLDEPGRSYVDLEHGVFYRLARGKRATNKRQPPVRLPPRLLAHMTRWARLDEAKSQRHFVEWEGKPVASVKTAFASAVEKAGIEHASPHTLRHTAATWMMQAGAPIWEAAGFLGMSEATLRKVYGHHHPDHMSEAAKAVGRKPKKAVSLVVSLASERAKRQKVA